MIMTGRVKYFRVLYMVGVAIVLQPTEVHRFGRLQRDPAPGSGALNSFANQYPRIKMVVSRYGGGNEFQPHCCFSEDYFAS